MVRRAAARAGAIARRNVRAAAERDGGVDRHDEMSAGFIGHLHGEDRSSQGWLAEVGQAARQCQPGV